MIPLKFVEYLRGPYALVLGSRDATLFAVCTYAFGCVVEADTDTVTVFVPNAIAGPTFENLAANGRAALLVGHAEKHETYQFKGTYLGARSTTEHEQAIQKVHQSRLGPYFRREWGDRSLKYWSAFPSVPSTAVSIRIQDIFDQTPGTTAGRRLGI